MWKMIIGVSSPETVTDNIFYYLYTTEDGVIHRKLYVKENGKPTEKEDEAIMPISETQHLTINLFNSKKVQWKKQIYYSSLELKEYFLQ